jgi:hypothetical protein
MKKFALCLIVLVFIALTSTTVFAGKQPDIMFHPDSYKYDIISGEITQIKHNTIEIEGVDKVAVYNQYTKFFCGDDTVAIERVYGRDPFEDCREISSFEIHSGDEIKARYTNVGENAIHLEVCLIIAK